MRNGTGENDESISKTKSNKNAIKNGRVVERRT
jgi:hypothetical protein